MKETGGQVEPQVMMLSEMLFRGGQIPSSMGFCLCCCVALHVAAVVGGGGGWRRKKSNIDSAALPKARHVFDVQTAVDGGVFFSAVQVHVHVILLITCT